MSEQAPRSNARLDNFEANKAAHDQEAFEKKVYGNAGTTLFNERALRRVEEGATYETHMEQFAADDRSAFDRGLDRLESGEVEGAFDREHADAIAENEAFDARNVAHEDEVAATIEASPELRRMVAMARDIAELKNRQVSDDNADMLVDRLKDKEDKLNELLIAYSETEGASDEIIDSIIDSTESIETKSTSEAEPATEASESVEAAESSDGADRSKVDASRADEEVVPVSDEASTVDVPEREDVDMSWLDDAEASEDEEVVPVSDEASTVDVPEREDVDMSWLDDAEASEDEEPAQAEEESAPKERFSWLRHPFLRAGMLYGNGMNRLSERSRSKESKRGSATMTAVALGAIATVGAITAYKLGAFDSLFGHAHGGNVDPSHLPQGGGHTGATPEVPAAPPHTPEAMTFSPAAHNVHGGEGWYETFHDMGIPKDEWSSLLQKSGPELHAHGWAYQMGNGSWGISHPGNLPQDMLELIQKNR
jgi:hypothetical protein